MAHECSLEERKDYRRAEKLFGEINPWAIPC